MVKQFKVVVERRPDAYVAHPVGTMGVVVGQGHSYEEALADVRSAIAFHLQSLRPDALDAETPLLEAFVAEAGVDL
ncbi:MAG TPA: type II toxin-antitoxin system HicB family antitoxin [Thermoanaerobaculia bacterium]|nr:type II toxin-antitoxin system HicB family antitoxin [Thermoanaerobaculia bacterium]